MKRVLSGIQPSGALHIGNYFGMMKKMIAYQNEADLFAFIANYHAMTSVQNGEELAKHTFDTAATFLALGIDPIWFSEGFMQYAAVEIVTDHLPQPERQSLRDQLIDYRFRRSLDQAPGHQSRPQEHQAGVLGRREGNRPA